MPRGKSAISAISDDSGMDVDASGNLKRNIINNILFFMVTSVYFNNKMITHMIFTLSEIAKLQRQFRIMEGDRQAYSIQARKQIRKQE